MLDGNIFRAAKKLLRDKPFSAMTGEEGLTVKAALIPLDILPRFNNKTVDEGLKELAQIYDEARGEPWSKRKPSIASEPKEVRNPGKLSEPMAMRNPEDGSEPR